MRTVIQRVSHASVTIGGNVHGKIEKGFMILVGICDEDTEETVRKVAEKISKLRIFEDENDVMNRSVIDENGEILCISQFTLYGDAKKGNRPSYIHAMGGEEAVKLYDLFCEKLNKIVPTKKGVFGADMKVSLINDGPTTIIIEI